MKVTLSAIKADIGGIPGHQTVHPDVVKVVKEELSKAKKKGTLIDFFVGWCGDDINLIMTHTKGVDNKEIHQLAWDSRQEAEALRGGPRPAQRRVLGQYQGHGPGCR
jgi:fructose 1,6-bisphosphate aldolase/phosphatase